MNVFFVNNNFNIDNYINEEYNDNLVLMYQKLNEDGVKLANLLANTEDLVILGFRNNIASFHHFINVAEKSGISINGNFIGMKKNIDKETAIKEFSKRYSFNVVNY